MKWFGYLVADTLTLLKIYPKSFVHFFRFVQPGVNKYHESCDNEDNNVLLENWNNRSLKEKLAKVHLEGVC